MAHAVVRNNLKPALQAQRRDPVLGRGDFATCLEPHRQRPPPPVELRARGHGRPSIAARAFETAVRGPPARGVSAATADEAVRPAQPLQIVPTIRVRAEPRLKLGQRARMVDPTLKMRILHHLSAVGSGR